MNLPNGRNFLTVRSGPLSTSWAENTAAPLRFGLSIHELFGALLSRELTVEIAVIFPDISRGAMKVSFCTLIWAIAFPSRSIGAALGGLEVQP